LILFIKVMKFFSEDWPRPLLLMQGFGSGEYLQLLQYCVAPVPCHNLISRKEQAMIENDSVGTGDTIQFTVFSLFPQKGGYRRIIKSISRNTRTERIVRTTGIWIAPEHMRSDVFERT